MELLKRQKIYWKQVHLVFGYEKVLAIFSLLLVFWYLLLLFIFLSFINYNSYHYHYYYHYCNYISINIFIVHFLSFIELVLLLYCNNFTAVFSGSSIRSYLTHKMECWRYCVILTPWQSWIRYLSSIHCCDNGLKYTQ